MAEERKSYNQNRWERNVRARIGRPIGIQREGRRFRQLGLAEAVWVKVKAIRIPRAMTSAQ